MDLTGFWRDILPFDEWTRVKRNLPNLVSTNGNMKELAKKVAAVAKNKSTVLLYGESGTGKEIFARSIHYLSPREDRPFVAINCAAITETLLESEFFGHERGAFTGADAQKKGLWEAASGGTLFLDEIGDLPLHLQAKILRAIETGKIRRVGGNNEISVDARIVAATNIELQQAMRGGRFRSDLFYRLNVVMFVIPPLRERREDIPLLLEYLLPAIAKKIGIDRVPIVSDATQQAFMDYYWRGNIRELENVVERALSTGENLEVLESERFGISQGPERFQTLHEMMDEFECGVIKKTLVAMGGNQTQAAKRLKVHRNTIIEKVRRYELHDYVSEVSRGFRRKGK